jgi:hypothetical protein
LERDVNRVKVGHLSLRGGGFGVHGLEAELSRGEFGRNFGIELVEWRVFLHSVRQ